MSTVTARSGKIAPVCQDCGWRGQYAAPLDGRVDLFNLGNGWCAAPYFDDVVHPDGATGSIYTCPSCVAAWRLGRPSAMDASPQPGESLTSALTDGPG